MMILDQLKRDDNRLQVLSLVIFLGMAVLVGGLWWVQIASSKRHEESLKKQSFRSVRIPALRGRIIDRDGAVLADNRPQYNVNLYFEELLDQFRFEYTNNVKKAFVQQNPGVKVTKAINDRLVLEARYRAVSNLTFRVSATLGQPQILDLKRFAAHFSTYAYVPFPIMMNLSDAQVAEFSEKFTGVRGLELETQPSRVYPHGSTAAHVLGFIKTSRDPIEDEETSFKYYFPYMVGRSGLEGMCDSYLRGKAGVQTLLVNNVGYRQHEEIATPTEPGADIHLTLDTAIQKAAEKALAQSMVGARGAAIVIDVRNGDVIALASCPTFDPNAFPNGITHEEWARLNDEKYSHIFNRATYGSYPPGSVFKIITALACYEAGVMNPAEKIYNPGYFEDFKLIGRRRIDDTAPAGEYDFERAFKLSSNTYFIHYGIMAGLERLLNMGHRFHLGERTGLLPWHEVGGNFPSYEKVRKVWTAGNTANVSMGQEFEVTPIQVAMMTAAIANGGKVFAPRMIKDIQNATGEHVAEAPFARGGLRADLPLDRTFLHQIHRAMAADVADSDGTGRECYISNFRVGGKTGTAELKQGNVLQDKITWFTSFGPIEQPRYAVVVMIQSGASGGRTCAPIARKIYEAIIKREAAAPKSPMMATF